MSQVPFKLWVDKMLQWNPDDYGGVDHVRLPTSQIWTPDITLYNRYDLFPPFVDFFLCRLIFDYTIL